MKTDASNRSALEPVVRAGRRRLLVQRALHELDVRLAPLFPLLALGAGVLILSGEALIARILIGIGLGGGVVFLWRALTRARLTASLSAALDESFPGRGVLGSAVEYLERDPALLDPFQRLVLRDAERSLKDFRLDEALPIGFRVRHASALLNLGLVLLLGVLSVHRAGASVSLNASGEHDHPPAPRLTDDPVRGPESRDVEALEEFRQNLERSIFEGTLSPEEGFQRLAALERKAEQLEADEARVRAGLVERGEALAGTRSLQDLAQALRKGSTEDARRALEALAERLQDEKQALTREELEALRESIEAAQERVREATSEGTAENTAEAARASEPREPLEASGASEASRGSSRAAKNSRQLERLADQRTNKEGSSAELSELDRELAEAARALEQDRHEAGERFAQAAETMGKLSQKSLTDEQKRELLEALRRMRERLREKGQSKAEQEALDEFRKKARGTGSKAGEESSGSEPGEDAQKDGAALRLSMEAAEGAPGSEGSEGGNQTPPGQEGESGSGSLPGKDHAADSAGPATGALPTQGGDKLSVAQSQEEGADAAQVVASAARKGFAGAHYRKLYQEYEMAREETLRRDRVPSGYRARVLRYFDLIRPRGTASGDGAQ